MTLLAAVLVLFAGCAMVDHQAEADAAAAQAENDRLKSEAAALRGAVQEQRQELEALKQQSQ